MFSLPCGDLKTLSRVISPLGSKLSLSRRPRFPSGSEKFFSRDVCWDSTIQTNPLLWHVSLETPIRYYRCGQQLYQPHSSYWKVWWYAPLLGSPPHGYVSVRPYVWLEMLQLSTTDMLWSMWSHCSNNCSAGSFRPTLISVLDWSQREKSSLSTTSKPTCLFSKENHNVLVCRKSRWNQLCASASWLAQ